MVFVYGMLGVLGVYVLILLWCSFIEYGVFFALLYPVFIGDFVVLSSFSFFIICLCYVTTVFLLIFFCSYSY